MSTLRDQFEAVKAAPDAEAQLLKLLNTRAEVNEDNAKAMEEIINAIAQIYVSKATPDRFQHILTNSTNAFTFFSKPRAAKIIKSLIDKAALVPRSEQVQIELCNYLIRWCEEQKRTYLKHRIELRLATLMLTTGKPNEALQIIEPILSEVRKADDKHLLVELYLVEAKVNHKINNYAKAKSSLTACRAASNQVYCHPLLLADIDMTSGIIYCHDRNFKSAYSYFFEAFEAFVATEDPKAVGAFKYMLLCKIMIGAKDEIGQLLSNKNGLKFAAVPDIMAMKSVAEAYFQESIVLLKQVLDKYQREIYEDELLQGQFKDLYNTLLENNLFKIIQSYTRLEIAYIAEKVKLSEEVVERKLSEM